jgi:hypothetical protein
MVDTKATTEAKKEHEAKKSALNLAKHFRRSAGTSRMYGYFFNNKPEDFDPALVGGRRIELMHFGRLNAIDIMDYWKLTYGVAMPARVSDALRSEGIISCRSVYHPRTRPSDGG